MLRFKGQKTSRGMGILVLSVILLIPLNNCKSPSSAEEDFKAFITANNKCGATVDVFMDGAFQFSVVNKSMDIIYDVSLGTHLLEAKLTGTDTIVFSGTIDVLQSGDYQWVIEGVASIRVINNLNETVVVLMNSVKLGEIDSGGSETVTKVPFGEYALDAVKPTDQSLLAETDITVTEIREYVWTITN